MIGMQIMSPARFARTALAPLFYVANLVDPTTLGPFRHTWSLAVEEQFYLVWPVLVMVAVRIPKRRLAVLLAMATAAGTWWRLHQGLAPSDYASKVVYETVIHRPDTCAFSLLAGATLAAAVRAGLRLPRVHAAVSDAICVSLVALPLAFGGLVGLSGVTGPVFATASALVLITGASTGSSGLLQTPSLRALGRVSYGWYLWHYLGVWLVHQLAGYEKAPLAWGVGVAVISLLLSAASWLALERPVLRFKKRFERSSVALIRER